MEKLTNEQFELDGLEYRTASEERRAELEAKWGARAAYFTRAEDNDSPTWLDIDY